MRTLHLRAVALIVAVCIATPCFVRGAERLRLRDVLAIARDSNPDITKARKAVDAADGRILQASSIPDPEFGIAWNEAASPVRVGTAHERDISIRQPIEFPGRGAGRVAVATVGKRIAELNLERTERVIDASVRRSYYAFLLSREALRVSEDHVLLLKDLQKTVTARYETNASAYVDLGRARVEAARAASEMAEAGRIVRTRERELNVLLGRDPEDLLEPADSLVYAHVPFDDDSVLAEQLRLSATIRMAALAVTREDRLVDLSKLRYLPDFEIGVAHQKRDEANNLWGIELKAAVPLWFWREPRGLVQEAEATRAVAAVTEQQTVREIRSRVRRAIDDVRTTEAQASALGKIVASELPDLLAAAISQYENGRTDLVSLLDLYRTNKATRADYAQAVFNYLSALAEVESASESHDHE